MTLFFGHAPNHTFRWVVRLAEEQVCLDHMTMVDWYIMEDCKSLTNHISEAKVFDTLEQATVFAANFCEPAKTEMIDLVLNQRDMPHTIDGSRRMRIQ
jgi:hypothetical protein